MPRGCSRATVSLPPARSGQRRLFAHCLNALKTFFGESPLADKGGICQGRAGFFPTSATVQAGVEVPGPRAGSWDQGGMQGKLGSKDALMGLSPGHPLHLLPPAQPCCHPSLATHTPPRPKTTPKPKSTSSAIHTGLAPALVLVLLLGGGVTVPRGSPQGKARPFPQGHGVAVGTQTLTQCQGDGGAALGLPANLLCCLSQRRAATTALTAATALAAAFVYRLNLY